MTATRDVFTSADTVPGDQLLDQIAANTGALYDSVPITLTAVAGADTVTATVAPDFKTGGGLVAGMKFSLTWAAANTGAVTLAINGQPAAPVLSASGAALVAGDLAAGMTSLIEYHGANFRVLTQLAAQADQSAYILPGLIAYGTTAAVVDGALCPIDTIDRNVIGAALSADKITLQPGTYLIHARAMVRQTSATGASITDFGATLRNVTGGADLLRSGFRGDAVGIGGPVDLHHHMVIGTATELAVRFDTGDASNFSHNASNTGSAPTKLTEFFAWKI